MTSPSIMVKIGRWLRHKAWVVIRFVCYDSWFFTLYQPLRPYWRSKWNPLYDVYYYILFGWCRWHMNKKDQEGARHWLLSRRREGRCGSVSFICSRSDYRDLSKKERWLVLADTYPFLGSYFVKSMDAALVKGNGVYLPNGLAGYNNLSRGTFSEYLHEWSMHEEEERCISSEFNEIMDTNSSLITFLTRNVPRGFVIDNMLEVACSVTDNFWLLPVSGDEDDDLGNAIKNSRAKGELWNIYTRAYRDGRPFFCMHAMWGEDVPKIMSWICDALPKGVHVDTYWCKKKYVLKGTMKVAEPQEVIEDDMSELEAACDRAGRDMHRLFNRND